MRKICTVLILSILAALPSGNTASEKPLRIALVGDSTMNPGLPSHGWGQALPSLLVPGVTVVNEGQSGASTRIYPAARWQRVLNGRPDFVFIQFGHNDSHARGNPESTDAATNFRENLRQLVIGARDAGATVVLVTPVRRRIFENGQLSTELAAYAEATRAVATQMGVPLLDLHESSGQLFTKLGDEGSTTFTLNKRDDSDRPGLDDRTHFTESGALEIARLVVAEFPRIDPKLGVAVRKAEPGQ